MPHPTPQLAASACACFQLRRAARAVTQLYDAALGPVGLRSTQFTVLVGIHVAAPVSLSELAERLGMDRTTLTRNLRPLEKRALVRVETDRKDARAREIRLSARGRRLLAAALPLWEEAQREIVGGLGPEGWQGLQAGLARTVTVAAEASG